jgi:hypothetical protein
MRCWVSVRFCQDVESLWKACAVTPRCASRFCIGTLPTRLNTDKENPQRQTPQGMYINLLRNEQTFGYGLRGSFLFRSTAIPLEYLHQSTRKTKHPRRKAPPGMNTNLLTNKQALTTACAGDSLLDRQTSHLSMCINQQEKRKHPQRQTPRG